MFAGDKYDRCCAVLHTVISIWFYFMYYVSLTLAVVAADFFLSFFHLFIPNCSHIQVDYKEAKNWLAHCVPF